MYVCSHITPTTKRKYQFIRSFAERTHIYTHTRHDTTGQWHVWQAVSELLAYLASEKNKGSKIEREDVEDLDEAGRSVLQGIDDFLELAPREDVLMVEKNTSDLARTQGAGAKRAASAAAAQKAAAAGGRELEGAVVGEGAFVAGAWVGQ